MEFKTLQCSMALGSKPELLSVVTGRTAQSEMALFFQDMLSLNLESAEDSTNLHWFSLGLCSSANLWDLMLTTCTLPSTEDNIPHTSTGLGLIEGPSQDVEMSSADAGKLVQQDEDTDMSYGARDLEELEGSQPIHNTRYD